MNRRPSHGGRASLCPGSCITSAVHLDREDPMSEHALLVHPQAWRGRQWSLPVGPLPVDTRPARRSPEDRPSSDPWRVSIRAGRGTGPTKLSEMVLTVEPIRDSGSKRQCERSTRRLPYEIGYHDLPCTGRCRSTAALTPRDGCSLGRRQPKALPLRAGANGCPVTVLTLSLRSFSRNLGKSREPFQIDCHFELQREISHSIEPRFP